MTAKTKWTVLTYIAAHNNLDQFGKKSLMEILGVGSTTDVIHGALYDGKTGAGRYVMGDSGSVDSQDQLGSFDSGDPDGLIATAKWLFQKYPAERYGLVLWSHGTGWEPEELEVIANEVRPGAGVGSEELRERASAPGNRVIFRSSLREILKPDKPAERAILFDDGTGHSLDTLELARVVRSIAESVGRPLDLLGMDACLMANIEVAYEIRRDVRHLAASEELVPGHSWPYASIFGELKTSPDMSGADLAKNVVKHYVNFYTANPPGAGDVTMVALDLGRIETLARETGRLGDAIRQEMENLGAALWKVQQGARQQETQKGKRAPNKFDFHLWDIGSLAAGLAAYEGISVPVLQAARRVLQAISPGAGATLEEGHRGVWFDGIGGVSAYLMPPKQHPISPSYLKLAFAKDTQWAEMLRAYHELFN
jgi:Clostripain family